MAIATLIEKKWLYRSFTVLTNEGVFDVEYDGNGMGYEEILVNGEIAIRKPSVWWYVPRFDFDLGSHKARVDVSISMFMQIKSFSLSVNGSDVYAEYQ